MMALRSLVWLSRPLPVSQPGAKDSEGNCAAQWWRKVASRRCAAEGTPAWMTGRVSIRLRDGRYRPRAQAKSAKLLNRSASRAARAGHPEGPCKSAEGQQPPAASCEKEKAAVLQGVVGPWSSL